MFFFEKSNLDKVKREKVKGRKIEEERKEEKKIILCDFQFWNVLSYDYVFVNFNGDFLVQDIERVQSGG